MGFAAETTYHTDMWLPGQQAYRKISSCSNTEAFQARYQGARGEGQEVEAERDRPALTLPNLPVGSSAADNPEIRRHPTRWGK